MNDTDLQARARAVANAAGDVKRAHVDMEAAEIALAREKDRVKKAMHWLAKAEAALVRKVLKQPPTADTGPMDVGVTKFCGTVPVGDMVYYVYEDLRGRRFYCKDPLGLGSVVRLVWTGLWYTTTDHGRLQVWEIALDH